MAAFLSKIRRNILYLYKENFQMYKVYTHSQFMWSYKLRKKSEGDSLTGRSTQYIS